jgi:signal transduction histidine kinase
MKLHETPRYLCPSLDEQPALDEIDIESIMPRETIIAKQDNICGEIRASTTIIQFRQDDIGDWDRIDSQVSAIMLRKSCDLLRRCVDDQGRICRKCDKQHADIFYGINKDKIAADELEMRIHNEWEIWEETYRNPHHEPYIEHKNNRDFLSYNCPMFGYRELMFPIFFEETVVAVFVIGQIKIEDQEEVIKSSKQNFFKRNPHIFDTYLEECKKRGDGGYDTNIPEKYNPENIQNYILNSKREIKPEFKEINSLNKGLQIPVLKDHLSQEQYEEMVKKVCNWLDKLENLLVKEMSLKRDNYARKVLAKALLAYHVHSANTGYSSIYETIWRPVQIFIETVAEQCSLEYIVVYGVQSDNRKTVTSLRIVAFSKTNPYRFAAESFSLQDLPDDSMMDKPLDSRAEPDLFNALNPIPDNNNNLLTVIFKPMKEIPAASVVILLKYSNYTLKKSIEDTLISSLQNLAALISSRLAVRFEDVAQRALKETLRLYKHEMVNLASGVSRAIGYLDNTKQRKLDPQKQRDVYQDAISTLQMFEFLSKNIGVLIDAPILRPKFSYVSIYHDLLYKWENIRRLDARDKGCDIEFQKSRLEIYTDPRYAEIVVYNLLTNAIKYAYDNTMIYIHCKKSSSLNSYVLSVTNFTFSIHESAYNKIFEMGFRSQKAREYNPEGSGIGLWIVRRIMDLLKGEVQLCEPEWISNYNVPLLHAYMNHPEYYFDIDENQVEAEDEYNRLSSDYILNDFGKHQDKMSLIVSKFNRSSVTSWNKVRTELHQPTYKIKFEVNFNV